MILNCNDVLENFRKMVQEKKMTEEQFNQRFQRAGGQLEKTADIRKVRRTIARIKTFLKQSDTDAPAKAKKAAAKGKKKAA